MTIPANPGTWAGAVKEIRRGMLAKFGSNGGTLGGGEQMPRIYVTDLYTILGLMTPVTIQLLKECANEGQATEEGIFAGQSIEIETFLLSSAPVGGNASRRKYSQPDALEQANAYSQIASQVSGWLGDDAAMEVKFDVSAIYSIPPKGHDQYVGSIVDSTLRYWQQMHDVVASFGPFSIIGQVGIPESRKFWDAAANLASYVDLEDKRVFSSIDDDLWGRIWGATKYAWEKSAEAAGKAAADIATEAGKTAGAVTKGFLGEAGPIAFVVAAVAVWHYV